MSTETPSMDTLCKIYVKVRTKKQEMTKAFEAEIDALDEKLKMVAAIMKDKLEAEGTNSMKTDHGTVYRQVKTRYYPMDYGAFGEWIIKNNAVDLLEKRVAQGNMAKWLEENPTNPPPGIQAESEITVTVRKA